MRHLEVQILLLLSCGGCHLLLPLSPSDPDASVDVRRTDTFDGTYLDLPGGDVPATGCTGISPPPLLCDDFEGQWPPDYKLYSQNGVGPELTTVTSSNHALLTGAGPGNGHSLGEFEFTPVSTGTLSIRSRINVTGEKIADKQWIVVLELDEAVPDNYSKTSLDIGPNHGLFLHCPNAGWDSQTGYPLKTGVWTCVELRLSFDAKSLSLWVGGKQVKTCPTLTFPAAGYAHFEFGAATSSPQVQVLHDDVVLARTPVGCP